MGGEPQCWAEGRCLIFDDSFLHTAYHGGKFPPAEDSAVHRDPVFQASPFPVGRRGAPGEASLGGISVPIPWTNLPSFAPPGSPEEGPRAVFMVDLWHPNVAAAERQALDFIFAPGR